MFHLTTALDAASGVPLYEQLYESLAAEMRSGAIPCLLYTSDAADEL